jgi:prepilin-type N-terminal cleavage/methylation domain-containing protein
MFKFKIKNLKFKIPAKSRRGFTLIEIITAAGLFGILMTVVIGSFLLVLRAQRTILAEKRISENVNFAIEFMSRQMRVAARDNGSCGTSGFTFTAAAASDVRFLNTDLECNRFFLADSAIRYFNSNLMPTATNLTDAAVVRIDDLRFTLQGAGAADNEQPRIRIFIRASGATPDTARISLILQTTVSSRKLDVP